jgi:two-component system chemotaxis response regulator CheB
VESPAATRDVIVVGASAGGVEALSRFVQGMPADLPASIFVVLHVLPTGKSVLPEILGRRGELPVSHGVDGEPIERGHVYVAPPDHHMLVEDGRVSLTRGPQENGHRPSIDGLFRSAARAFGARVIAVVLTGSLDDGTLGTQSVKDRGGIAIAQDPDDALYPDMPANLLERVTVDHVARIGEMPALLGRLVEEQVDVQSREA